MTTTDGVYIDGELTVRGDMTGPVGSQLVLRDPAGRRGGAGDGARRHRALRPRLAQVRRRRGAQRRLRPPGPGRHRRRSTSSPRSSGSSSRWRTDYCVLNADDPRVARWPSTARPSPSTSTMDPDNELVRRHIRERGRAVVLEEGLNGRMIVLYDGEEHIPLLWARQIPATLEGQASHNIQNAMFAAAIAYASGGADARGSHDVASRTSARGCAPSPPTSSRPRAGSTSTTSIPSGCCSTTPTTPPAWRRWREVRDWTSTAGASGARRPRRPPRRGHPRPARPPRRPSTTTSSCGTTTARGRGPQEVPDMLDAALLGGRRVGRPDRRDSG